MTSTRAASAAGLCVALVVVAFGVRTPGPTPAPVAPAAVAPRSEAPPAEAPPAPPPVERVETLLETAPPLPASTAEADDPGALSDPDPGSLDRDDDRRRRRRWRRRNIYPGPIPTPEEWEPPEGPVRIALQVGHWKTDEAPGELSGLRDGGTRWRGTPEWEVNLGIARRTAELLEEEGYEVELLPAVVPPGYRAHLFVSIHADGSADPAATGYRIAAPRRDATGRADQVVELLERTYGDATGLPLLPDVTRRMRNYYAFNFRRYRHALHPMTIAVILETGFLTSARDRSVIVDDPERAARGIVDAVRAFPVTRLPQAAAAP